MILMEKFGGVVIEFYSRRKCFLAILGENIVFYDLVWDQSISLLCFLMGSLVLV